MPALRRELSALDPTVPAFGVRSMPQFLNRITSLYDMGASLIGTFAIMALALVMIAVIFGMYRRTPAHEYDGS